MSYANYYSDKTSDIDDHWFFFTQIQFEWILKLLKVHYAPDDMFSVMDLGCGTGRLLSMIADVFPNAKLNGVDGTPKMVKTSLNRLGNDATITQANLNNYVPDQSYDVVISTTVMHHLDDPDAHLKMIGDMANTHAFVSEFAIDTLTLKLANIWWGLTQKSHKQAWSSKSFQTIIQNNSLTISDKAILKPDNFWRLQIYDLRKTIKTI